MEAKYKIILGVTALLVAFAFGRFSASSPPSTTVTDNTKIDTQAKDNKDTKTHSVTVTEKEPTGEIRTTTTIDTSTIDRETEKQDVQEETKTVTQAGVRPRNSVGLLLSVGAVLPSYGVLATREILGPVYVGAFGMATSGFNEQRFGIVVGVNF